MTAELGDIRISSRFDAEAKDALADHLSQAQPATIIGSNFGHNGVEDVTLFKPLKPGLVAR